MGDTVDDYEIVAKLKAGGMATLYLGRRTGAEGFSRHVAIKVVHEHLANDPTFVQMFVDEALLSAKIHHPNVVHVEELRTVGGRHMLAMEYVHGCALSTLIGALRKRGRTMSPELAVYVAVKVAEGLHAAHETKGADGAPLGVVHRDVTPQNVLLAYRGHVKLIDFGVAKARGRAQQTTGASLKGKIGYMSPEQAFGRPVDRRTDVYALGVVLWEMLAGRRAFMHENDFALLELVRDPKLPPASSINPAVSPALDAVIARATAKEMDDRFETAQQMRKALAQALPAALALDASDLEKLLAATLGEEMDADRRALPASVSGVVSMSHLPAPEDADAIVGTLTVSAAELLGSESGRDPASGPSGVRERSAEAPRVSTPSGTMVLPEADAVAQQSVGAPSAPRTALRAIVVVAALLAAVAGAVTVWVVVSPSPEMEATELPRADEAAAETEPEPPPPEPVVQEEEETPAAEAVVADGVEAPAADDEADAENAVAASEESDAEEAEAEAEEPASARQRRGAHRRGRRVRTPRVRPLAPEEPTGGGVPLADEF